MPIQVTWDDDEKTIIRWVYDANWTWNDAYQAHEEERAMVESVPHIVDAIADMRGAPALPKGSLTTGVSLMNKSHERIDLLVILGANRLVQGMYDMMRKLRPVLTNRLSVVMVQSEAEAYQVIAARRAERPQTNSTAR